MAAYEVMRGANIGKVLADSDFVSQRRIRQMIDLRQIRQLDDMPDRARMTVREIAAAVKEMDADAARELLDGEDRKSARELLEQRLEVLNAQ